MPVPSITNLALLLGLSFFFGLAFEEFYAGSGEKPPGGVRTFPLLAIAGAMLHQLDPAWHIPFTAGLLVLGAWLYAYYRHGRLEARSEATGPRNVGLMVPLCNLLAYLIGPITLTEPHWMAIGMTVAAVLLFTARERLHTLAQRIELDEIVTAGKFLILTGLILPLLPNEPVTTFTTITPYHVWLALLTVCTLSYASYLVQRYLAPPGGDIWIALLGGLYSSTATTVVLARQAAADPAVLPRARAGITLATAIMYLRLLAIIAVFNRPLAGGLAPALIALAALGLVLAGLQYRRAGAVSAPIGRTALTRNPLELSAAALFAALFVLISVASNWVASTSGQTGIYALAAVVGIADIDPFVLNLAQGGAASLPEHALVAAILFATASNNLLKACYTAGFAGRRASLPAAASLVFLALAGAFVGLAVAFYGT